MNVHQNSLYPFRISSSFLSTLCLVFRKQTLIISHTYCLKRTMIFVLIILLITTFWQKYLNNLIILKRTKDTQFHACTAVSILIFSTNMVISGAIIDKLVLAVEYNSKYQSGGYSVSRKLPSFCSMNKDARTQTDFIPDCTLDRFLHLYKCEIC